MKAGMAVTAVVFVAIGGLFVWSATRGASVLGTLRSILSPHPGQAPADAAAPDGSDSPPSGPSGRHIGHTMTAGPWS